MTRLTGARAVMFGVTLALGGAALPSTAAAQVALDGRSLFQQARVAYDGQRWDEALALFQQSMTALPSPNTRLYVGRCLRALPSRRALHDAAPASTIARDRRPTNPSGHDSQR